MRSKDRRVFMMQLAAGGAFLAASCLASAQAVPLQETDPAATALGYKADATKVDRAKYATYAPGRQCNGCMQWKGSASDATAACGIFPGKLVAAKGWCTAWVKKA